MTVFIECDGGILINAAMVARIVPVRGSSDDPSYSRRRLTHYRVVTVDGDEYQTDSADVNISALTCQAVPAAAGSKAVLVACDDAAGNNPTADDIWISWAPIVAWRLSSNLFGGAEPIFPDNATSNQTVFIELPDGRFLEQESGEFESLDEVKAAMLARAQQDWERRKRQGG
jgi:hypothetical protein